MSEEESIEVLVVHEPERRRIQLFRAFNRSADLLNSLARKQKSQRDRDAAMIYNTLRADVKKLVNDPKFGRSVPSARCLTNAQILASILVLLAALTGTAFLITGRLDSIPLMAVPLLLLFITLVTFSDDFRGWLTASTIDQIYTRTVMLRRYLQDYIRLYYPNTEFTTDTIQQEKAERQLSSLQAQNRRLSRELAEAQLEVRRSKETLASLETPEKYEVPTEVLDKLDPLERTRLLEAVQAYRVGAWTPAAAVCGMILEGRLQQLCRHKRLSPGRIGDMIQRLGEAGYLKGYHHDLAKVGEFFRHRASHPTSEHFDREKTTLVLTSLVILIRDRF